MDIIFKNMLFSLARAALATFLAKELYSVTVPTLLVFSVIVYEALTRDPLRSSLPPFTGFKGIWNALRGLRRARGDKRELVRLSFCRKDVIWVSRQEIMNDLLPSGQVIPVMYGDGIVTTYGDNEKAAIEKVFTSSNLAMFQDVMEEEETFFIDKVSKAHFIGISIIQEFVTRTLQRMVYGMGPRYKFKSIKAPHRRAIRGVLLSHFFPFFCKIGRQTKDYTEERKLKTKVLCLEGQLQKQTVEHPDLLAYSPPVTCLNSRRNIVDSGSTIIASSLHQALVGLLSNYQVGRQAQVELDKLVHSRSRLSIEDTRGLVTLPAIVAESLRLSLLTTPMEVLYFTLEDLWYKKWFLPKHSIVILDCDEIFANSSKLTDGQFRPQRFFDKSVLTEDVDAVAFPHGLPQKQLVKTVLFNAIATVLRRFNIVRSQSDGKFKYVQFTVKPTTSS